MASYTNEYSNFPNQIMSKKTYKNVTDEVATLINNIKKFQAAGDYSSAALLIASNPSIQNYIIDAAVINAIIEEQRNTEIYAKTVKQSTYTDSEPNDPINDDLWIGGE